MTKNSRNNTKPSTKKRNGTKGRTSTAAADQRQVRKQSVVLAEVHAVHGLFPSPTDGERAVGALTRAGFREDAISIFPIVDGKMIESAAAPFMEHNTHNNNQKDLPGGTAARIAGIVLGVSSVALATPVIAALSLGMQFNILDGAVVVEVKTDNPDAAKKATAVLLRSGGRQVGLAGQYDLTDADLKSREYRDAQGRMHHHTHTYLQDHADAQRSLAA
jgi:hypothetical protein